MQRLNYRNIWLVILLLTVAFVYIPINHLSHSGVVLLGSIDRHIPFIPLFVLPYLIFLLVFWTTIVVALISGKGFVKLALAVALVYLLSNVIYLLYPTYMLRPEHIGGWLSGVVQYIYQHDRPYCDFPSEHASSATLFALYWWAGTKWQRWAATAFAVAVVASTLFIKQHSVAGAAVGVFLALTVWAIVSRFKAFKVVA